jgi:4-hydroxybenzoate polyprenyltransferase
LRPIASGRLTRSVALGLVPLLLAAGLAISLYWISHMWLTAHRGRMTDDPLVFAIKDRVSLVLIVLTIVIAWFAV